MGRKRLRLRRGFMDVEIADGAVRINGRRINLECPCHEERRAWWERDPPAWHLLGFVVGLVLGFALGLAL